MKTPFPSERFSFMALLGLFLISLSCSKGPGKKEDEGKGSEQEASKEQEKAVALFFGNSLTAGSGISPDKAFPALIQQKVDSAGWSVEIVNSGVSGQTSSGGLGRIDWVLEQHHVDLFLLELGANDGLRGLDPAETRKNLQKILDKVRERYPEARLVLAGMKVPPNMGPNYSEQFESVFRDLAEQNDVEFIPFLLKGVAGKEELNQKDGVHPTPKGHKIVAETVWKAIKDELRAVAKEKPSNSGDDL